MGGLSFSGFITPALAWGMLLSFYLLSILVYLGTYALGEFKMSFSWFGPTEIRLLLIVGNLVLLWKPKVHFLGHYLFLFDIGALCAIAGMVLMAGYSAIRNTAILYRQERIR
jgi:hypothetical protein